MNSIVGGAAEAIARQAMGRYGLAAVPGTATEIERYRDAAEGNRIRLVHAQNDAERFEAERDAALAAVDRVRAVVKSINFLAGLPPFDKGTEAMTAISADLLAALDGAPEPEWEERTSYGVEMEGGQIVLEPWGRNYVPHQRTARFGPWLP